MPVDGDEPVSDAPGTEQPLRPTAPADGPDEAAPDIVDDMPRISSLRAAPRASSPFSMRRLLNVASVVVASVALLALAVHWLPDALPKPKATPNSRTAHAQQTLTALHPLARGAGWKPIGPDWAEDIAFSADGSVGYACGHFPPEPVEFFAVYHVTANGWEMFPSPLAAPAGGGCRVAVSPIDPGDVALITTGAASSQTPLLSRIVRSHDGGATWKALSLPSPSYVTDIDWTDLSLFLVTADSTPSANTPPLYHLLVSHADGPLSEITAQRMIGRAMTFDSIFIQSSGRTLYAELSNSACAQTCTVAAQSDSEGVYWTQMPPTYQGQPLVPVAAQVGSNSLVGWSFMPQTGTLVVLRSDDNGKGWRALPALPRNPATGSAELFILPDSSIFAFTFGDANTIYALQNGADNWRTIAPLPAGSPLTVAWNGAGHALALWGEAHAADGADSMPGLEYFPLSGKG